MYRVDCQARWTATSSSRMRFLSLVSAPGTESYQKNQHVRLVTANQARAHTFDKLDRCHKTVAKRDELQVADFAALGWLGK
jgi:hypothetical protein